MPITAVIVPTTLYDPDTMTPTISHHHDFIGATATAIGNISDTATTVIPAIVILVVPPVFADAPTSAGGCPSWGVGVACGIVVV